MRKTGFDATVATFRDANGNATPSDFSATIDWGDGTRSAGQVSATAAGGFQIDGSHFYTQAGTKAISVAVKDIGGSSAMITSTAFVAAGGTPNGRYVESVFENVLGRPADENGWVYWIDQLPAGTPISNVAESIAHSDEYYANFVIKPDYLKLLGRTADAGGETFWETRLADGQTRLQVAQGIAGSTENNTQLINDDYFHYLGRAADAGGLAHWLQEFANGQTNEDVIAGFTGSAEYYKEHTT